MSQPDGDRQRSRLALACLVARLRANRDQARAAAGADQPARDRGLAARQAAFARQFRQPTQTPTSR